MLDYLNRELGVSAEVVSPWAEAKKLPLVLQNGKKYYIVHIDGATCVLVEASEEMFNVRSFRKQMESLPSGSMPVVLCFHKLDSRSRKALIEERLPFIVPGSQAYLPFLGITLRERAKAVQYAVDTPEELSSAAQLVLLQLIYEKDGFTSRKVDFAKQFNISAMDVTRAVRELAALELVSVKRVGREDWVAGTITGRKLYEKAKPYMITPVKKRVYVRMQEKFREFPLAGESALAERTMLCEPMVECRAIFYRDFNKLVGIEIVDPSWTTSMDYIEMEIWRYDPRLFAQVSLVDVISLALSLQETKDERVEQAIDEMMEEYKW